LNGKAGERVRSGLSRSTATVGGGGRRPAAHRGSRLPKELPGWFAELDTDGDGQIGLYEWKTSGRSLAEFRRIDRNDDGFLTVEEVLRYVRQFGSPVAPMAKARPVARPVP
jgi:hypothetical protein